MNRPMTIHRRRDCRGFEHSLIAMLTICLLAAGGVIWVYMGMITQQHWPIRWLEIDCTFERVSAEQMIASIAPFAVVSFFTVDLEAVKEAAYRQAWVADVSLQKTWPDTVKVRVREYAPVAHWDNARLISAHGDAFHVPGADEIQGLPWLSGPDGQLDAVFKAWQQFNSELIPAGLEIELIRLDPRGAWFLELTIGTEVHIGREEPLSRLRRLVKSWPKLMQEKDLAPKGVDLRYTNGFAVRWPKPPARFAGTYGKEN